jgi:regulator of protease activity HflC (stomatin/prohibitin superfamily)
MNEYEVYIALIMLIPITSLIASMIVITPGKTARILETFGRPCEKAKMPGMSFKLPWPITQIVASINLQLREIGEDVSVKTLDNSFMVLPVKVQYKASSEPRGAVRAYYELENSEQQIISYVLNSVRQTASSMTMIDLYQNRNNIESQVQAELQEKFIQYGYMVQNVLVDEPQPSQEVRDAFNRVIASEREKEAAKNIADAERIKLVGVATAEKESKELQGQGIASMREAIAKGFDKSMQTLTATGLSTQEAVKLLMDTNRLDTLSSVASHGNLIIADIADSRDIVKTISAVKAGEK